MKRGLRIVFAGYLVRCPTGGYMWQVAHYLLGLRALGHDAWFYEDNGQWAEAYNPETGECANRYDYGLAAAADFFNRIDIADRWVFADIVRGAEHGPAAGSARSLLREADLLVNFGGANRIPLERRRGRPTVYVDSDPGYTQLKLESGDQSARATLDEHTHLFTFGENIGTPRSPIPTGGYTWHPTRQPIVTHLWEKAPSPGPAYTTVGKWDSLGRDITYQGEVYSWRKRSEFLRFIDLPARTGMMLELAMNVDCVAGDSELLASHGWRVVDPVAVSRDPWRYRDYVCGSRAEFSAAKDINVRLRSGWFSDRSACYLAAGRPVVLQDTGFGDVLPLGPGLHAVHNVEEAAEAVRAIEADYDRAGAHAKEVARELLAAERVVGQLLQVAGL